MLSLACSPSNGAASSAHQARLVAKLEMLFPQIVNHGAHLGDISLALVRYRPSIECPLGWSLKALSRSEVGHSIQGCCLFPLGLGHDLCRYLWELTLVGGHVEGG